MMNWETKLRPLSPTQIGIIALIDSAIYEKKVTKIYHKYKRK